MGATETENVCCWLANGCRQALLKPERLNFAIGIGTAPDHMVFKFTFRLHVPIFRMSDALVSKPFFFSFLFLFFFFEGENATTDYVTPLSSVLKYVCQRWTEATTRICDTLDYYAPSVVFVSYTVRMERSSYEMFTDGVHHSAHFIRQNSKVIWHRSPFILNAEHKLFTCAHAHTFIDVDTF